MHTHMYWLSMYIMHATNRLSEFKVMGAGGGAWGGREWVGGGCREIDPWDISDIVVY